MEATCPIFARHYIPLETEMSTGRQTICTDFAVQWARAPILPNWDTYATQPITSSTSSLQKWEVDVYKILEIYPGLKILYLAFIPKLPSLQYKVQDKMVRINAFAVEQVHNPKTNQPI